MVESLSRESIEQFRQYIIGRGLSQNTTKAYSTDLTMLVKFAEKDEIPMRDLSTTAGAWLNQGRYTSSPRTTGRRLVSVRAFAKWAGDPYCLSNYKAPTPAKSIPHPIPEGKAGIMAMLDACKTYRERALIGLMGLCGARIGEALDTVPSWFDIDAKLLTIRGKGDKTRIVPVSTDAWHAVAEAYVWATVSDPHTLVRLQDRHARAVVKQIGQRANLSREISSHDLRHTFATELLNKGVNIRVVQELLGHASVETTQIYTGVELEALRTAVEL